MASIGSTIINAKTSNDNASDINEAKDITSINIYPNLNNGKFIIDLGENLSEANAVVTDVTGKEINKMVFGANTISQEISINEDSKGIYFVTITQGDKKTIKKIIIE
jgi:hypothetical protein